MRTSSRLYNSPTETSHHSKTETRKDAFGNDADGRNTSNQHTKKHRNATPNPARIATHGIKHSFTQHDTHFRKEQRLFKRATVVRQMENGKRDTPMAKTTDRDRRLRPHSKTDTCLKNARSFEKVTHIKQSIIWHMPHTQTRF